MIDHITTKATEQGYLFKCSHCNKSQRLRAKTALNIFNKTFIDFSNDHKYCQPKVDGRGKYAPPPCDAHCLICGYKFSEQQGKVPLYRFGELSPSYAHLSCAGGVDYALFVVKGKEEWLYSFDASKVTGYEIGHHNLIVQGAWEWLYFWQGRCGSARNKAEAMQALENLRNQALATTNDGGAIG